MILQNQPCVICYRLISIVVFAIKPDDPIKITGASNHIAFANSVKTLLRFSLLIRVVVSSNPALVIASLKDAFDIFVSWILVWWNILLIRLNFCYSEFYHIINFYYIYNIKYNYMR